MEGGYLPWKNQKVENNCPSPDYFTKSLPPPPAGQFWERDLEGNWKLMKLSDNTNEDGTVSFTQPSIIEHIVMPIDTIQGLCLQYHAKAIDIRRMNMFSGNNIQVKTKLLIPINAGVAIRPQIETEEVILQKFKNITQEQTLEARIYLEEHKWNFENALQAWKNDNNWEETEAKLSEHQNLNQSQFSAEIEDVVAPLAIQEVPIVTALAVSYVNPSTSAYNPTYNDVEVQALGTPLRSQKRENKTFFLLRPFIRK